MRVHVRRRAQVGVPEQFLYELQVACFLVHNRCGRVPEGMEAGSSAVASDRDDLAAWTMCWILAPTTSLRAPYSTTFYSGHAPCKGVISAIYPKEANGQLIFLETNFDF